MSIIILALSIAPCVEAYADVVKVEKVKTELVKPESQEQQNPLHDSCSPFCHCSHCPSSVIMASASCLTAHLFLWTEITPYTAFASTNAAISIWQPPQLS